MNCSNAAENRSSACWKLCSQDVSSNKSFAIDPAVPKNGTLVESAVTVDPIYADS